MFPFDQTKIREDKKIEKNEKFEKIPTKQKDDLREKSRNETVKIMIKKFFEEVKKIHEKSVVKQRRRKIEKNEMYTDVELF